MAKYYLSGDNEISAFGPRGEMHSTKLDFTSLLATSSGGIQTHVPIPLTLQYGLTLTTRLMKLQFTFSKETRGRRVARKNEYDALHLYLRRIWWTP